MSGRSERGSVLISMSIALAFIATAAFVASRQHGVLATDVRSELDTAQAQFLARAAVAHATWKANQANCSGIYPNVSGTISGQGTYSATASIGRTLPTLLNSAATGTSATSATYVTSRSGTRPHSTTVTTTNGTDQADTTTSGNDSAQATTTYGANKTLTLNNNQEILLPFSKNVYSSTVSELIILKILTLNAISAGTSTPVTLYVNPITTPRSELAVTWNQADSTAIPPLAWTTVGADYSIGVIAQTMIPATITPMTIDLTAVAEAWKNNNVPFISNRIV